MCSDEVDLAVAGPCEMVESGRDRLQLALLVGLGPEW